MFLRVGFWATTLTVSLRTDIIEEWLGTDLNDFDDWHGIHLALLD